MRKGLSIVITSASSQNSKHFFISKKILDLVIVVAVVVLAAIIIVVVNYGRISYRAVEAEILRRRNAEIEKEFSKIEEIKKNLEMVEANNKKLKTMLGIEKTPDAVKPIITEVAVNYSETETTVTVEEKNIPSLMPTNGQISKRFGIGHEAIDIAAPLFSPVIAVAAGRVLETGWDSLYGNYLTIEHSKNYSTFYGHLNSIACKKDNIIRPGELIGTVGSSGKSTSPHLHYEVRFQGTPVDPMAYLPYFLEK